MLEKKKKVNINTVHLFYCIYYLVVSGVSNLASGVSNIRSQNCNDLLYCYCRFIQLLQCFGSEVQIMIMPQWVWWMELQCKVQLWNLRLLVGPHTFTLKRLMRCSWTRVSAYLMKLYFNISFSSKHPLLHLPEPCVFCLVSSERKEKKPSGLIIIASSFYLLRLGLLWWYKRKRVIKHSALLRI